MPTKEQGLDPYLQAGFRSGEDLQMASRPPGSSCRRGRDGGAREQGVGTSDGVGSREQDDSVEGAGDGMTTSREQRPGRRRRGRGPRTRQGTNGRGDEGGGGGGASCEGARGGRTEEAAALAL